LYPKIDRKREETMKILVVDDEMIVREVTKRALEVFGYEAVTAENGRKAIELLKAEASDFAAVLTDYDMPELSGPDLLKAVRAQWPHLRVICITGNDPDEVKRCQQRLPESAPRFDEVLAKPIGLRTLEKVINRILGKA